MRQLTSRMVHAVGRWALLALLAAAVLVTPRRSVAQGEDAVDLSSGVLAQVPDRGSGYAAPQAVDPTDLLRLPNVVPAPEVPAEVRAKVQALAAERDRALRGIPRDFPPVEVREIPEGPLAPPRLDSGESDPDRTGAAPGAPPTR